MIQIQIVTRFATATAVYTKAASMAAILHSSLGRSEANMVRSSTLCVCRSSSFVLLDDEPIRMMPNSPTRPTNGVAVYPSSPTSPMSFRDFLPANAMTSASSPEPPRRKVTLKTPAASSLQRAQTSPGGEPPQRRQSLWNAVRSKTMPTKMRGVVDSVVRRTSGSKEHSKDRQYERLDRGSSSKSRSGPSPSRHGKYTSE